MEYKKLGRGEGKANAKAEAKAEEKAEAILALATI